MARPVARRREGDAVTGALKCVATYKLFEADCGVCGSPWGATKHGRVQAERALRADGWSVTTERGWVCPACVRKRRRLDDATGKVTWDAD